MFWPAGRVVGGEVGVALVDLHLSTLVIVKDLSIKYCSLQETPASHHHCINIIHSCISEVLRFDSFEVSGELRR